MTEFLFSGKLVTWQKLCYIISQYILYQFYSKFTGLSFNSSNLRFSSSYISHIEVNAR